MKITLKNKILNFKETADFEIIVILWGRTNIYPYSKEYYNKNQKLN